MLECARPGIDGLLLKKPFTIPLDRKSKYAARIDMATVRGRNMVQSVARGDLGIGGAPIIEHGLYVHRIPSQTKIRQ